MALLKLLVLPLLALQLVSGTPTGDRGNKPAKTLDSLVKANRRLYYGTATDKNTLSDVAYEKIVLAEYGSVTPENSMKWESTEPARGNFTFENSDFLVRWATKNRKLIRGHTLVWHSQLPQWVKDITDKKELTRVIENHIKHVAGRYRGKLYAWDVINEIFEEDGSWRKSVFSDVLGPEFVRIAFRAAHKADPHAKLYLNDYNLDFAGAKVDAYIKLAKELIKERVPIHGIGSQAHLILNNGGIPYMHQPLKALADTGLDVALTEIDVRVPLPANNQTYVDQKRDFETITKACLSVKRCVGMTSWGVTDKYSWVPDVFPGEGDALLWDKDYNKKPAYDGVVGALRG